MPYTNTNINDKGQVGIKKFGIDPAGGSPAPPVTSFIFTIDTTNAGSAADTFVLPLVLDGVIDMDVYWGDGNMDTITTWNQAETTHVYAASGTYIVSIARTIRGWQFGGGGDKEKILNIQKWGDFNFTIKDAFKRCTNLTSTATDVPAINLTDFAFMFESCPSFNPPNIHLWDMAAVTRINWMFFGCTAFDQPIGSWNTANVYEISYMLYNCTSFDQDLSAWNVASVTNYGGFLTNGTLSTANYDALLIGWDAQAVSAGETPDFGNSIFTNCSGAAFTARANLISSDGWTITDGGGLPVVCPTPFEFSIDTTNAGSAADTFIIPLVNDGVINIDVDWGDATTVNIVAWNDPNLTHVYAASGNYIIKMTGTIRGFKFDNGGDCLKIIDISEWGDMNITQDRTFYGCANLTASAIDAPTVSTTNLSYTFAKCDFFNTSIDSWDVSGVTNMQGMFWTAGLFNQDLNSWNVSNVTTMNSIFSQAAAFNGDISAWTITSLLDMTQMFYQCPFNQDISAWNTSTVTNTYGLFRYNTVFNQDISTWDMSSVLQMGVMFGGSTAFDQDISGWNVSACTNMWGMFQQATSFDQDLGGWDVSNVATTDNFLQSVTLSTANYDALLIGWDALALQSGNVFSGGNSIYSCGTAGDARANMIASDTWTITDGGSTPSPCPTVFTFEVDTTQSGSAADTFVVPLVSNGAIDLVIDWGDASSDVIVVWNDPNLTHVYAASGTYTITITATTGTLRGWTFGWGGDRKKMTNISEWGDFEFTNGGAFTQCSNMTCTATDIPTISATDMSYVFFDCTLWNPANVGSWNVSSCTNINSFFGACSAFNQDIDAWDVSNVSTFAGVFYNTLFNYPLLNWDTGNGTSFNQMFFGTPFNQDIDMWDMSSASSLYSMFSNCTAFNQDLNSWNTSNVSSMSFMFGGCTVFDGDISSWNTSNCSNFSQMFIDCPVFNQDISSWDVSAGTNFSSMFRDASAFAANISTWDVSSATNFSLMFRSAVSFNQNISGWNVGNVTNMNSMFFYALTFDQPIGVWNTSSVTDMRSMLRNNTLPTSFDQDISGWDITSVAQFGDFMTGTTISTAHYDALLVGWEAQAVVSGTTFNGGNSTYSLASPAATARAALIAAPNLWTITDGGGV